VQRALDDPRRGRAGGISQRENEPMVKKNDDDRTMHAAAAAAL